MKPAKTKINFFVGTLSIEFDDDVVNFDINDAEIPTYNFYVNFLGANRPLSEDCCEFSNHLVQERFSDINFSYVASKKLTVNGRLGEEKLISVEEASKKKLKIGKFGEEEKNSGKMIKKRKMN